MVYRARDARPSFIFRKENNNMCKALSKEELQQYQAIANILQHIILVDPDSKTVNAFKLDTLAEQWPCLTDSVAEQQGKAALASFFEGWTGSDAETLALRLDFTRLFCGPDTPLAAPWGSVYLCENELLNDTSTQALSKFYSDHNIELTFTSNEPVDHIGLMFAVLSYLLGSMVKGNATEYQQKVVSDLLRFYLLPFANRVMELIKEHAGSSYYQGMALLGSVFLNHLSVRLSIIPLKYNLYR